MKRSRVEIIIKKKKKGKEIDVLRVYRLYNCVKLARFQLLPLRSILCIKTMMDRSK